jgi:chromate transporter
MLRVFGRIGLLSFGGPAGQIALMHRELVEQRRWLSEERFLHALNFCMLLPGPEAMQLATYAGWLLRGWRGGLAAGLLFVLPGLFLMLLLATLYSQLVHLPWLAGVFLGLKAAVLVVVVEALHRVAKRALKTPLAWALAGTAFVALFALAIPFPLVILTAGVIGFLRGRGQKKAQTIAPPERPARPLATLAVWLGLWGLPFVLLWATAAGGVLMALTVFFSKMAVVTFGGAYAVLTYVAQQAVNIHGWITAPQMIDALALAETTPGPLILVLSFVGFLAAFQSPGTLPPLLAGLSGGLLAAWVTFVPCFLWILLGAPYMERLRGIPALAAALSAITAAVVGVILNLTVWFAFHGLFADVQTLMIGPVTVPYPVPGTVHLPVALLAAGSGFLLLKLHWPLLPVLGLAAAGGVVLQMLPGIS